MRVTTPSGWWSCSSAVATAPFSVRINLAPHKKTCDFDGGRNFLPLSLTGALSGKPRREHKNVDKKKLLAVPFLMPSPPPPSWSHTLSWVLNQTQLFRTLRLLQTLESFTTVTEGAKPWWRPNGLGRSGTAHAGFDSLREGRHDRTRRPDNEAHGNTIQDGKFPQVVVGRGVFLNRRSCLKILRDISRGQYEAKGTSAGRAE